MKETRYVTKSAHIHMVSNLKSREAATFMYVTQQDVSLFHFMQSILLVSNYYNPDNTFLIVSFWKYLKYLYHISTAGNSGLTE